MRRSLTVGAFLLCLLVAVPRAVRAQDRPQTRQGFFIGFGFGWGSFGCDGCNQRNESVGAHLKLGGTLLPNLLLGVESSGWTKSEGDARISHGNLSGIVQFYPMVESGFFLKGGIGFSRLEVSSSFSGFPVTAGDNGFGWTGGLGYDLRVGTNVSLTPYGSYQWGDFDGGSANHFQLGLGVTFH